MEHAANPMRPPFRLWGCWESANSVASIWMTCLICAELFWATNSRTSLTEDWEESDKWWINKTKHSNNSFQTLAGLQCCLDYGLLIISMTNEIMWHVRWPALHLSKVTTTNYLLQTETNYACLAIIYACRWSKMGLKSNSSCRQINTTYSNLKTFPLIYEYTQQIMTHFSISRAATFLFSYSLSLRALTMFGVNGEKSFSVFIFSKYLRKPP